MKKPQTVSSLHGFKLLGRASDTHPAPGGFLRLTTAGRRALWHPRAPRRRARAALYGPWYPVLKTPRAIMMSIELVQNGPNRMRHLRFAFLGRRRCLGWRLQRGVYIAPPPKSMNRDSCDFVRDAAASRASLAPHGRVQVRGRTITRGRLPNLVSAAAFPPSLSNQPHRAIPIGQPR